MALYLIDTESGTCVPFSADTKTDKTKAEKMVEILASYKGTKEYDGVVADIQKWYYGHLVEAPWCATCLSWLFNKVGITDKAENVRILLDKLTFAPYCTVYFKDSIPRDLKKGDILFFHWTDEKNAVMTTTSSKHVGLCEHDTNKDKIPCLGGNQSDSICTMEYDRKYLYAIARLED